jgi:hypothetical protein
MISPTSLVDFIKDHLKDLGSNLPSYHDILDYLPFFNEQIWIKNFILGMI